MEKRIEYNMIDLGLPSGLKWADRNVGAVSLESYGDYFAWGETKPRGDRWDKETPYDWAHAPFNNGSEDFDEEYFNEHKSEWLTENGTLKPEYDAVHAIMGGNWRMPTLDEVRELVDGTRQISKRVKNVECLCFISKANDERVFIPMGGLCKDSLLSQEVGYFGYVWSSSNDLSPIYSRVLLLEKCCEEALASQIYHYLGCNVRGVHK